jgi:hypothetical protein
MGRSGLAASTIGIVFLACISLGYFGGAWLDRKFGTTIWTPALTVFGMLAGFVETFRTLRQITRESKWPGAKSPGEGAEETTGTVGFDRTSEANVVGSPQKETDESAPTTNRQRLFHVPPPPLPEYAGREMEQPELTQEEIAARLRSGNENDEPRDASRTE